MIFSAPEVAMKAIFKATKRFAVEHISRSAAFFVDHREQRRKNAAHAALLKTCERGMPFPHFRADQGRDQKP
jgi:hypothetical protein